MKNADAVWMIGWRYCAGQAVSVGFGFVVVVVVDDDEEEAILGGMLAVWSLEWGWWWYCICNV